MARIRLKKENMGGGGGGSFALMVGDEGAILVHMQRKRVVSRFFAATPDPAHTQQMDKALNAAPHAPITVLVDMMDQSYVRQTLPPVSSFSVGKIVRRRLDKDFSPDDIKGYVVLGREATGRKDWNYLMASLANTAQLQAWLGFVVERTNPFRGLGLLPLESQAFMNAIQKALLKGQPKDTKAPEWQLLVSHHKVGGFRQVVLKGGKLAFTRMAQPIGESSPAVIAGNIEQEVINTLEYLKRMGLSDPAVLSLTVIASDEIRQALDPKNVKTADYHFYTPFELAEFMGLASAAQEVDHFGDVVVTAFVLRQRRLTLPLDTVYTKRLRKLNFYLLQMRAALGLVIAGMLLWAGANAYDIYGVRGETEELQKDQVSIRQALEAAKIKSKLLPKEITFYGDVIAVSKFFNKSSYNPTYFLSRFLPLLKEDALVNSFHWTVNDPTTISKDGGDKRQVSAEMELRLTLPNDSRDQYNLGAQALAARIKTGMPNFDVTHSELPGSMADTKEIKAVIEDAPSAAPPVNGAPVPAAPAAPASVDTIKISFKGPLGVPDDLPGEAATRPKGPTGPPPAPRLQ